MTGVFTLDARPRLEAAALDGFLTAQRAAGLMHGTRPVCRVLSPLAVTHATYRRVRRAAELVASAMERLVAHVIADDRLAALLGIDATERALQAIEPGYPGALVIARLDMVFLDETAGSPDGFAFLELNADSPAGITDQAAVESTLYALAPVRDALAAYRAVALAPVPALLEALLTTFRAWGGDASPRIAIVDWSDVDTAAEQAVLQRAFVAWGVSTVLTTPEALRWDGHRLSADGVPIDLVYRRLIARELRERLPDDHPLLQAARAGAICLANPLRSTIANRKSAFAVLSDPAWAHLFTAEERVVLDAHVPWTRALGRGGDDEALCRQARAHRHEMVLKPDEDYGGRGVVLGWTVDDAAWAAALERGVADGAVLQRRVAARRLRFPTFDARGVQWEELGFDLNPFLFRGRVEGAMVRVSAGPLSNVSAGGGVTGLLVVDDDVEVAARV